MKKLLMALALIAVFVEISLSDAKAEGFEYNVLYYVIDLSGGTSAKAYPVVAFDAEPEGGWTDEYKTTKLVLRRVEAGAFIMGNPVDGFEYSSVDETQHTVTLTKPYYIGVFEVTQKQWELVMGTRPSCYQGDARPVEQVSWNMIRGDSDQYNWPSENAVDVDSFVGKLRLKTGLMVDLPTEAEWEYACRAGTTTHLNSGKDLTDRSVDENMNELGRYQGNVEIPELSQVGDGRGGYRENHTTVGSYKANAWGLYDMHGNVVEWCLDWRDDYPTFPVMDPVGPISGTIRVLRGGGYTYCADNCRSAARNGHYDPSFKYATIGFRLACSVEHMMKSTYSAVPGEKVEIDTGLIGYTAKGLPSGLKYDKKTGKITGAAKKPTAAEGVTVKFTKRNEPDAEIQIVVGPMPKLSISLEGDTEKCKVKGAGAYLVGKKVSLSATAPKGTAFTGWFANGAPWPNEADCRKAKLSYVMTRADVSLVAKFEKERMSVGCAGLEGRSFTVGVAGGTGIPLEIETQSGVKSVKVSKLPAGMKYNAKTGLIEGAPTKAGDYTVQIAVTAKSGAVETKDIAIRVDPLPDWAVGTFSGMIGRQLESSGGNGTAFYGSLQFTVKATGAVSAKVTAGGKTYSFSAKGFRGVEDGDALLSRVNYPDADEVACRVSDTLVPDLATKKGDALLLGVTLFQKSGHLCVAKAGGTFVRSGCATPYGLVAWRNEAGKDSRIAPGSPAAEAVARLKNLGKVYLKARELEPRADGARHFSLDWWGGEPLHRYGSKEADFTLSVDKSGNVKVSGKIDGVKLTASTPLRFSGNEWFSVSADSIAYDKKSGMDYEFILGWDTIDPHTGAIFVTPDPNADPLTAGPDMHGFELWIEPFE